MFHFSKSLSEILNKNFNILWFDNNISLYLLNSFARFEFIFINQLIYFSNLIIDLLFFDENEDNRNFYIINNKIINMINYDNDI